MEKTTSYEFNLQLKTKEMYFAVSICYRS